MVNTKVRISSQDYLVGLSAVYAVIAVAMNIFCMKSLSFGTPVIVCDGGQTISWIVFLVSNVIVEAWDERTSIKLVSMVAIISFAIMTLGRLIVMIPTLESYQDQANAFAHVFSNGPRTILSSVTAFWVGNLVNVHVIFKLKERLGQRSRDNRFLFFLRAAFSTLIGQLVDNALFMVLAFAPIGLSVYEMAWNDILSAVWWGTVVELVIECFFVPFITIPLTQKIKAVKALEGQAA